MLSTLYYRVIRPLITKRSEHNEYSGGLWPRLVREKAGTMLTGSRGRVVELGCGEGLFLDLLARRNPEAELYGIDTRPQVIEQARNRLSAYGRVTLLTENALTTSLEPDSCDVCFCMNTVLNLSGEHAVRLLFAEARRILRPGGVFIFDTRNALNPLIALQYRFVRWYDPGITVPVTAYRPGMITRLLGETGFLVTAQRAAGFPGGVFAPAIIFETKKAPRGETFSERT